MRIEFTRAISESLSHLFYKCNFLYCRKKWSEELWRNHLTGVDIIAAHSSMPSYFNKILRWHFFNMSILVLSYSVINLCFSLICLSNSFDESNDSPQSLHLYLLGEDIVYWFILIEFIFSCNRLLTRSCMTVLNFTILSVF